MNSHELNKDIYAEDVLSSETPRLLWEFRHIDFKVWDPCTFEPAWYPKLQYRHKTNQ